MNILGISYSGHHESAACLIRDDELIFASAEERFSRIKQDSGFPMQSIQHALQFGGLNILDIDHVALNWPHSIQMRMHDLKLLITGKWPRSRMRWERWILGVLQSIRHKGGELDVLRNLGCLKNPLHFINHHLAHALSAYCLSGFNESGVLIVDGRGANESTTLWYAKDGYLKLLETYQFPNSLGVFYAGLTDMLGFQPLSDEWKVMGLAAYGQPNIDLGALISINDEGYYVHGRKFFGANDYERGELETIVGRRRDENQNITREHENLARSAQECCERAELALLRRLTKLTGSRKLCMAGGVALNSKANGELLRSGLIDDIYIQPAAGDDGGCIGAAFAVYQRLGLPFPSQPINHTYLGNEFTNQQIENILHIYKLPYHRVENIPATAARLLADNRLLGWFQGRMEFGPRALGARSILADPRFVENRDRVNEAVKFREGWRPFAPSILHEKGGLYFDNYRDSPYMLLTFRANDRGKREIPAVVHVDGSARIQSVHRQTNPVYYDMIAEFEHLTGVPVVMNTSFNLKGDPIVCTPKDAIQTFYTSGLDDLIIGDFIVSKNIA